MDISQSSSGQRPINEFQPYRRVKACALVFAAMVMTTFLGCGSSGNNDSTNLFTLGGTVSGLAGTGLVLQNNGANSSPVNANGVFALSAAVARNSTYNVTVLTQPSNPAQTCVVSNGSGTVTANVTSIQVVCTTIAYTIGGSVAGLTGTGLVLQDNGGDNLPIGGNVGFTFSTPVDLGDAYNVTVLTEPSNPTQTCIVANSSGTANANVTNVAVTCSSTIGGTVQGLSGSGLLLQYNGGNNLLIGSNGPFVFPTPITYGSAYVVTVLTQPANPAEACLVLNGSGTIYANVTNVQINCSNNWTWIGGPNVPNQAGIYGTMGVAAPGNIPGARWGAVNWTDKTGNFWLYGGTGYDSNGTQNGLSDLWEYSAGEWTWRGGSNLARQPVVYGTQGVAAPGNTPGTREGAAAWTDAAGNFWLFGGIGYYVYAEGLASAEFNDLWEYSGGQWTWMSGSNLPDQPGTYGTLGVAAPGNSPGSRGGATTWIDAAGTFWLFGGNSGLGCVSGCNPLGMFNDLWKYSAGQWTWIGGSNTVDQAGTYGTLGTAAPSNTPGARSGAFVWVDSTGDFWLFGGFGYDTNGTLGDLSDLWKYSAGEWTWVGGPNTDEAVGSYGMLGVAAPGNIPGSRDSGFSWVDASGNFWLFGGSGNGSIESFSESLGDVWKYSGGEWTWMGGSNAVFQPAIYETMGAPGDPGGRASAACWIDKSGNLWLFGGSDQGTSGHPGYTLSDLWQYKP